MGLLGAFGSGIGFWGEGGSSTFGFRECSGDFCDGDFGVFGGGGGSIACVVFPTGL